MHCANCALIPYRGFSQIRSYIVCVYKSIYTCTRHIPISAEEDDLGKKMNFFFTNPFITDATNDWHM